MKIKTLAFYVALSCVGASGATQADEQTAAIFNLSLEELLNIQIDVASSKSKNIYQTPSTVSVITREMIQSYNFQTIAEAVNTISGFTIMRTGARRDIPTARGVLQDHYPNKVLFMINGVPTWMTNTGGTTLGHISPASVKRIEVLKGPASVLYGSNAYVGAINVVLNDSAQDKDDFGYLGVATEQGIRGGVSFNMTNEYMQLFASVNAFNEKGNLKQTTDALGYTGYYRDFMNYENLTIGAKINDKHNLLFNTYGEEQTKLGVDPEFAAGLGKPQTLFGYLFDYHYDTSIGEGTTLQFGASYDYNERVFPRTGTVAASGDQFGDEVPLDEDLVSDVRGNRLSLYFRGNTDLTENLNFDYGLDHDTRTNEQYRSYNTSINNPGTQSNLKDRKVKEWSAFGQMEYTSGDLTLLLGSRYTDNEYSGTNTSSRATMVYQLTDKSSIKLNYGQSFRAPSSFELFFLNTSQSLSGNTSLKPEQSETWELAYLASFDNFFVQALIYHANYQDKIFRRVAVVADEPNLVLADGSLLGDTGRVSSKFYANGSDFSAKGLELETKYQKDNTSVFANYTLVDGDDGDRLGDHYNFKYPPKHKFVAGINQAFGNWSLSLLGTWYSKMQAVNTTIDAQSKWDLNLKYHQQLTDKNLTHTFSVKNLGNKETLTPDYVDRQPGFPVMTLDLDRRISYTLTMEF